MGRIGADTGLANPPVRQTDGLDPDVATLRDLRLSHPDCRLPENKNPQITQINLRNPRIDCLDLITSFGNNARVYGIKSIVRSSQLSQI